MIDIYNNNNSNNSNNSNNLLSNNNSNNQVDTTSVISISPRHAKTLKNKKRSKRKRLSSEAIRGLIVADNIISKSAPQQNQQMVGFSLLDVGDLDDDNMYTNINNNNNKVSPTNTDTTNTNISDNNNDKNIRQKSSLPSTSIPLKTNRVTEDPLSIIVGSWNVSESEINYANLKMWIPSSIEQHDIYVIGLQECSTNLRKQWINGILKHIDCNRKEYVLLNKAKHGLCTVLIFKL